MKAALFGGSFNPPHYGHLIVGEAALDHLGVERVVFVPAGEPPHKAPASLAPAADRLRMTELAIEGNDGFEVWDAEVRSEGPNYTIDTVRNWKAEHKAEGPLDFLIGADTVWELHTWKRIEDLFEECRFVPFVRPGADVGLPGKLANRVGEDKARAMLRRVVRIPLIDISATEMRSRIAAGRSVRYLTPDAVRGYIESRKLYRHTSQGQGRRACAGSDVTLKEQEAQ